MKLSKSSIEYQLKLALIYQRTNFDCPITGKILDVNKSKVVRILKGDKHQDFIVHNDAIPLVLDKADKSEVFSVEIIEDKDLMSKL